MAIIYLILVGNIHPLDSDAPFGNIFIFILSLLSFSHLPIAVTPNTIMNGILLASAPLIFPAYILVQLLFIDNNPLQIIYAWLHRFIILTFTIGENSIDTAASSTSTTPSTPPVASQLLAYVIVAIFGYWATDALIPIIKSYTLRKGISGKDLGKRGTALADKDV